jgi:hypothetical protein
VNCCDDYGNCNQGRDCPARKRDEEYGEPLSELDALMIYLIIAVALVPWVAFIGVAVGYVVGIKA